MVKFNDREIVPNFSIGRLERFEQLTGIDIIFNGSNFDRLSDKKHFIEVVLDLESSEIDELHPIKFVDLFAQVMEAFSSEFKDVGSKKKKEK